MNWSWLRIVAGVGAVVQVYFAYKEMLRWDAGFVASAAPAWVDHVPVERLTPEALAKIAWATPLAFNMGLYNLVLAIGLVWVAVAGTGVAGSLGIFLGVWLLAAAAAALWTGVYIACVAQGLLGLLVLLLSRRAA